MKEPRNIVQLVFQYRETISCVVTFECKFGTLQLMGIKEIVVNKENGHSVGYDAQLVVISVSNGWYINNDIEEEGMKIFHSAARAALGAANTFLGLCGDTRLGNE